MRRHRRKMRALRGRYGFGHFASAEGSVVQALLFPTSKFTVAQAKAWSQRHGWRMGDVDAKPEYIHLRQEDPSRFKKIRTIYLGGSGVMARVGWK